MISSKINENELVLLIDGRIDSSNASQFEEEAMKEINANPKDIITLDASKLLYISSAGLRVILKVKKAYSSLSIINAEPDVYDIFEMTGFTEMMTIQKAYKKMSVDGCKVIGKGAKGTVYRYNDDTVIKVYNDANSLPGIKNERELARKAFVLGVPTAISYDVVMVDDKYGSVFELLDAKCYSQLIAENPNNYDKYVENYTDILKKIHSLQVKESDMPDGKILIRKWIKEASSCLNGDAIFKLTSLVESLPNTLNMLHCDYHTNNLMMQNDETLLIDMDTLSRGHKIFDLANIYVAYVGLGVIDPNLVENFMGFSYQTSKDFWKKFIRRYVGIDDETNITDIEKKIQLLGDVRLIRHIVRRGIEKDSKVSSVLEGLKIEVNDLLNSIETLDF